MTQAAVNGGADETGLVRVCQSVRRPVPLVYFGIDGANQGMRTSGLKQNPNYRTFSVASFPGVPDFSISTRMALLHNKVKLSSKTS